MRPRKPRRALGFQEETEVLKEVFLTPRGKPRGRKPPKFPNLVRTSNLKVRRTGFRPKLSID